jgi:AcrR family transcriptional regulator
MPKVQHGSEKSERIIEAAKRVFSDKGIHQATMDEIAKEAEVSKGAIYLYFKGKDKIISTLLKSFFEVEMAVIRGLSVEGRTTREVLEEVNQLVVKDLTRIKVFMPILFEFISMTFRNKEAQKVVRDSLNSYIEILEPIIQTGIDRGDLREMDAHDAALAYGALLEGTILLWSYDLENYDFADLVGRTMNVFLDGIEN